MLRDIVVHIPVDQSAQPIIDCATSIGSTFDAYLEGIACVYPTLNPAIGPTFDPVMAFANTAAGAMQYNTDQAESVLNQFRDSAKRVGISHAVRCISNGNHATISALTEISRLYDLSIVAQPDQAKPSHDALLPEAVLFGSGRPMLMIPYIHVGPLKLDRALVCWDGSQPAARAVHDAMPFLRKARATDIVTVNEDSATASEVSAKVLQTYLARHDISADIHRRTARVSDIYNDILSLATDIGTNLMVMGGYGHSRLREVILGGVTRGMFKTLTVPALISH
jgi:nucleotide-binding universal stress UspA family protein